MRTRAEPFTWRPIGFGRVRASNIKLTPPFRTRFAGGGPQVFIAAGYSLRPVGLSAHADDGDGESADVGDAGTLGSV